MSLLLLLNPKQYGGEVALDQADIWRKRRKKLQALEEAEETLAIQKLLREMKPVDNFVENDKLKLHKVLSQSISEKYQSQQRRERERKILLLLLLADSDE